MYKTVGKLIFDPRKGTKDFEPWWVLLNLDREIQRYYAWHLERWGVEVCTGSQWGCHISVVKGEKPPLVDKWGQKHSKFIKIEYDGRIRYDNGKHAWIDVYSDELSDFRASLGLHRKRRFHITIGRLKLPFEV
jgi:hypothetical protein